MNFRLAAAFTRFFLSHDLLKKKYVLGSLQNSIIISKQRVSCGTSFMDLRHRLSIFKI